LCVDADVLIEPEQFLNLIQSTQELDKRIFQIQGMIMDKFFQVWRPAGQHIYRTPLLKKAISYIPEDGKSLRPETDLINQMSKQGYPWIQSKIKVGVHDFEQYYEDIYRKCFLHAIKHRKMVEQLEDYWQKNAEFDFDFRLALIASQIGKIYEDEVNIDKEFNLLEFNEIKKNKNIDEKPEFNLNSPEELYKLIADAKKYHNPELQDLLFPPEKYKRIFDLKKEAKYLHPGLGQKILTRSKKLLRSIVRKI
jgi:hypothetical protein